MLTMHVSEIVLPFLMWTSWEPIIFARAAAHRHMQKGNWRERRGWKNEIKKEKSIK